MKNGVKRSLSWCALALVPLGAALAQGQAPRPAATDTTAKSAAPKPAAAPAVAAAPDANSEASATPPVPPKGGTELTMRGLDKITGRPTSIVAPVGKPVHFATLTITARYCYSTPPSETPEPTAASSRAGCMLPVPA